MNEVEKFNNLVHDYGLDERETKIDEQGMVWFTNKFLTNLFNVTQPTIDKNIKELTELGEIDFQNNIKKFILIGSKKPVQFYDINVLYSLGMWLKSQRALEFRQNIKKLLEGLRKGDLKLIDVNKESVFYSLVSSKQPTSNHQKNHQIWVKEGWDESTIKQRDISIFFNLARNELLVKLELANPYICSKISDIFNCFILGDEAKVLRDKKNVPACRLLRDYLTVVERKAIMTAESNFCIMVEHDPTANNSKLLNYARIADEQGHYEAVKLSKIMNLPYHDMTVQADLFEVIGC